MRCFVMFVTAVCIFFGSFFLIIFLIGQKFNLTSQMFGEWIFPKTDVRDFEEMTIHD